jgi:hypothetical protein
LYENKTVAATTWRFHERSIFQETLEESPIFVRPVLDSLEEGIPANPSSEVEMERKAK